MDERDHPPARQPVLFRDVWVTGGVAWRAILRSYLGHAVALSLIAAIGQSALFRTPIVDERDRFERSTITYYTVSDFLPAFQIGPTPEGPANVRTARGAQRIESTAAEPVTLKQTILAPPEVELAADVPLPNLLASNPYLPPLPPEMLRRERLELPSSAIPVVQPAPEMPRAARSSQNIGHPNAIPPMPLPSRAFRPLAFAVAAAVEPLAQVPAEGRLAPVLETIAAPLLPVPPQAALASLARPSGTASPALHNVSLSAAVPPASVVLIPGGGTRSLVALNAVPAAIEGTIKVPNTVRPGTFAVAPEGRAAGESAPAAEKTSATRISVAATPPRPSREAFAAALVARPAATASVHSTTRVPKTARENELARVADRVFSGRVHHAMIVNMPNLTSATGSWVMRYAAMDRRQGELSAPVVERKVDAGYPADLRQDGVEGSVTLYAIIRPDGTVGDVRVLEGVDARLDANAQAAIRKWRFRPGTRGGEPVAVEAVVQLSFAARNLRQ